LLIKIKIKRGAKAEKRLTKPPSRARNFAKKLIGADPTIPNITNYTSTIRIRWVKKMSGEKFGSPKKSSRASFRHPSTPCQGRVWKNNFL